MPHLRRSVARQILAPASYSSRCHLSSYRYAAYGSNLHLLRLKKRVSSARQLGVSFISTYDLGFNKRSNVDGSAKCNIIAGDRGVHIAVFEVASSQKADLDRIEGLGEGYNELALIDPDFGELLTYVADPSAVDDSLAPTDWYREMVLHGCKSNDFPSEYIRTIEAISSIEDTDEDRSRAQWEIVEELRNGA